MTFGGHWTTETYRLDEVTNRFTLPCVVSFSEGFLDATETESISQDDVIKIDKRINLQKVVAEFVGDINEVGDTSEPEEVYERLTEEILIPLNYAGTLKVLYRERICKGVLELKNVFPRYAVVLSNMTVKGDQGGPITIQAGTRIEVDRVIPGNQRVPDNLVISWNQDGRDMVVSVSVANQGRFKTVADDNEYTLNQVIDRYGFPVVVSFVDDEIRRIYTTDLEEGIDNMKLISATLRLKRLKVQDSIIGHYKPLEGNPDQVVDSEYFARRSLVVLPLDNYDIRGIHVHVLQGTDEEVYEDVFLVSNKSNDLNDVLDGTLYVDFRRKPGPRHIAKKKKEEVQTPPPRPPRPGAYSAMSYFIGVDVGTSSVRAALVKSDGQIIASATKAIKIWTPEPNFYQQSSEQIWEAVIETIKTVCTKGGIDPGEVAGLGFDATCSMVVLDKAGKPVSVCPTGDPDCDIIMWMDHRASNEADFINTTKHEVLKYVGGVISLEMETPKLMWLKKNLREQCWNKAEHFMDLCDFLTWRCTNSLTRSLCSVVSKWTYVCDGKGGGGFDPDYFTKIGLEDVCDNNFAKIGTHVQPQGQPCGNGLSKRAAFELGLKPGTAVSVGMIDAHCGTLGCLGCVPKDGSFTVPPVQSRLAMISGTSTCHMAASSEGILVQGVWGPFWSSILPGLWSAEGGQSAAGKLIDFVVTTHHSYQDAKQNADKENISIYAYLNELLVKKKDQLGLSSLSQLTKDLHVWPDFHGNRSPLADHTLRGMVCGMNLQSDEEALALLYLATVQALAYGTKHIIDEMNKSGHQISVVYICGGLRKNSLYIQTHADITGFPVIVPDEEESVLLGAAILAACAAKLYPTIEQCMKHMCGTGKVTMPNQMDSGYHKKKFNVFLQMYQHQRLYQQIMNSDDT